MKRPCIERGCPLLTGGTRCPRHQAEWERRRHRPTTSQRGYGYQHRVARQQLASTLPCPCGYCGGMVYASMPWVAAHVVDGRPEMGYVVAHPVCNQRAIRRG